MQGGALCRAHCVIIANATNSWGPAACVLCFNRLAKSRPSRRWPYTSRSLGATQGSTLPNVQTAGADTWVSCRLYLGMQHVLTAGQCHYSGYTKRLAFQSGRFHLEVGCEVSRELKVPKVLTACCEESDTLCPPQVLHHWELECFPRPVKRTYAEAGK
jgi:hypothetical protein